MPVTPRLIVLSEQLRGQSFELTGDHYTVGRTDDSDIPIPDPTISSRHCVLQRVDEERFCVVDQGSTNGTRVNGARLEGKSEPIQNSDILQFGAVEMLYDCEDSRKSGSSTTQTVINLQDTEPGDVAPPAMRNFSPFGAKRSGLGDESKRGAMVIGMVIGALVVAVLVVFGYWILQRLKG